MFDQVVRMYQKPVLVSLGYVALDGIKIRANASKNMSMSQ